MAKERKRIDWDAMEPHYRAGIRSLKSLAEEFGCSDAAIVKHAREKGWTRDLTAKIQAKAAAKVAAQVSASQVSEEVSAQTKQRETQVVEANAEVIAQADLLNREDVLRALRVSRSQLDEIEQLGRPEFREALEWLGNQMRSPNAQGMDKQNDLYCYIIDLAGRVKMAKEVAAAFGVYIPMQRKILKLDAEANGNQAAVDEILRRINAEA